MVPRGASTSNTRPTLRPTRRRHRRETANRNVLSAGRLAPIHPGRRWCTTDYNSKQPGHRERDHQGAAQGPAAEHPGSLSCYTLTGRKNSTAAPARNEPAAMMMAMSSSTMPAANRKPGIMGPNTAPPRPTPSTSPDPDPSNEEG